MLVVGCESIEKKTRATRLNQSLKAYAGSIRWGNFETAAAFAVPRESTNSVNPAALDGIKVTGYVVRVDSVSEDAKEANVHLSFSYYDENRGTVGAIDQDATWYLHSERENWLMDDSLPLFNR